MSALGDIAADRQRLVAEMGFGDGRADDLVHGQLARAAAAYAGFAGESDERRATIVGAPSVWPWWSLGEWKPKDRRHDLVRAGALIVAEIERLDRLAGE